MGFFSWWPWRPKPKPPIQRPPVFGQRTLSMTVTPGVVDATLSPKGDREVEPIKATGENHISFLVPAGTPGWGANLDIVAEGYKPYSAWIELPLVDSELDAVVLEKDVPEAILPAIRLNGKYFSTDAGPFTWIGCTDFRLYHKYLSNEDVTSILTQRQLAGFNALRVLSMCANMFSFNPANYPNYYSELPSFLELCASFGFYVEFTVFADAPQIMPDQTQQINHWRAMGEAVKGSSNCILELVNEVNHPSGVNRIDPSAFPELFDVINSRGSNISGDQPPQPPMDYETFHWNDLSEWQRKVGHNAMEDGSDKTGKPAISNENTRFPDHDNSEAHAYDAAAGAALLCAGSVFHSVHGKTSDLWDGGVEWACATAWARGARSVPLWVQPGFYQRHDDPSFLRVYSRTVPGVGAHVVTIRY